MGHIQYRSGIIVQRILQNFLGENVKVVGGLVQDQKICVGEHEPGKADTPLLAAAQITDALENVVPSEEEGGEHIADLGVGELRVRIGDFLKQRLFRVENMVLLIVVADLHVGA